MTLPGSFFLSQVLFTLSKVSYLEVDLCSDNELD